MILNLIKRPYLIISLAAIGLAMIAISCGGNGASTDGANTGSATVRVITSMYPLEYFTAQIGGDRVQVDGVVSSGGDVHDFEPTPGDLRKIAGADLIVYNGLGFESWIDALLAAGDAPDTAVQASSSSVARHFDSNGVATDSDDDLDPHLWLDPVLAVTQVRAVTVGLVMTDPEGRAIYMANSDALIDRLTALDRQFTEALGTCSRDTFITSHDSFNYMAARYGVNAIGISGINPESEPSPRALADLSNLVSDSGIEYVLVSPIDSERLSDTLARETGVESLPLHSLQNLTSDQKKSGETYFSLMEQNLASLVTALGCDQ